MPPTNTKKLALIASLAVLLVAGLLLALHFSPRSGLSPRQELLEFVPPDATSVIFLDLGQFQESPFLRKIYSWAPQPAEDSEYAQFVRDTGFSYERDLKRVVIAISNHDLDAKRLIIADGEFDRKKIDSYLQRNAQAAQQGKWKVYLLNENAGGRRLKLVFLSDSRIAIGDSQPFSALLSTAPNSALHAEWNERFERLAGTPLFAVIRQDPALQAALGSAAPGGFRSPQLSALLDQLQWISIAGRPEGDHLRLVSEGECLSEQLASQLRDFLAGLLLLAQNGLNDPKLRREMNPEEREAYLEILKSADVQKLDRGQWKSVRLVLAVTPRFLDAARAGSLAAPAGQTATPEEAPRQKAAPGRSKTQGQK
jgi:hypothetical protein